MHRARVSAVNGNRAQAEGKWLNIIGNRTVSTGDYVWTDGRCVYGNFQEGGSPAPIIDCREPYVPIFMKDGKHYLYHKGKLKEGLQGEKHQLMINMGNTFAFSDKSKVLDVSLSQSGELQELIVERYAYSHGSLGYSYHYYDDGRGAKSGIYFDGEKRDYYWQAGRMVSSDRIKYANVLREGVNVVGAQSLEELKRQTPSNAPESMTALPMAECRIIGGWYESEKEYCLFLKGNARSLYMSGRNLSLSDDSERCWEADYGTLYSLDVEYMLDMMADPSGITILRGRYNNNKATHLTYLPLEGAEAEPCCFVDFVKNLDLPVPDGFKLTMSRRNQERIEYDEYDAESYSYELKSAQGRTICEFKDYEPGDRLLACKLKTKAWLTAFDGKLYWVKNGKKQLIDGNYTHRNSRLRSMRNYSKWMKGDE